MEHYSLHATVWQVIFGGANFRGSQRRPSELMFVVLNFVTETQSRGMALHKLMMYMYTGSILLAIFLITDRVSSSDKNLGWKHDK